jgi:membrane-associated protein
VTVAAAAGAPVGYVTGRRLGRPYLERRHGAVFVRVEAFYARYGIRILVAARFVPWARTLAPVVAGAVAMPMAHFMATVVVGAVLWGFGLVMLGYAAAFVPGIEDAAPWVALAVVVATVAGGAFGELLRRRARSRVPAARPGQTPGPDIPLALTDLRPGRTDPSHRPGGPTSPAPIPPASTCPTHSGYPLGQPPGEGLKSGDW